MQPSVVVAVGALRYAAAALRNPFSASAAGRSAVAVALGLLLTVVSACGQTQAKKATAAKVAGISPAPSVTVGTRYTRHQPAFQAGVIVYADGNDPSVLADTTRLLDHLVDVKVNSVALAFPLYQSSWTSTDVHADAQKTPSPALVQSIIQAAHQRNLALLLRPLIDDTPLMQSGHWRGQLQPSNLGAWFASYKSVILTYATPAETEGAEVLDIGTELNSLQSHTAEWMDLIASIRAVYKGQLTYSSNWDVAYPAFGSGLDFASVDGFYPLSAPNGASVAQLVGAWGQWTGKLDQIHSGLGKPVVLTELGTTSEVGSYRSPYDWQHGTGLSLEAQRRYYAASCQALKPLVAGMYWWVYYSNWFDKVAPLTDPGYQPAGKPAEQEITNCYR